MSKVIYKHNPCETHFNVRTDDDWCPICLVEERDQLKRLLEISTILLRNAEKQIHLQIIGDSVYGLQARNNELYLNRGNK